MARYRNKKPGLFSSIISLIFFLSFISSILEGVFSYSFDLLELFVSLGVMLIFLGMPILLFVGFCVLMGKLFSSLKKTKVTRSTTTVSTRELLELFNTYFKENERLYIDADTYVVCNNPNGDKLEDYDLYMNDEYISDLKLFANSFPSGFNSFAQVVKDMVNPKKKKKQQKKQEEIKKEEPKVEQTVTTDCAFYISRLNSLSGSITNQQIREGLSESIKYLNQIKKIEDEFPECKTKTTKLYQYYLPMLSDILQNYNRLSSSGIESDDLTTSEDRLLKTIVLINGALKTISSSLTEDYYTDLKVDMKTLESVLKKDGLVDEINQTSVKED